MNQAAIFYRATREFILPISRQDLFIRLAAARSDIRECRVIFWKRNQTDAASVRFSDMKVAYRDAVHDDFRTVISFPEPVHYIKYYFKLIDFAGDIRFLSENGLSDEKPADGFFEFLYVNTADVFSVPEWAKGIIYYQIFPDRFYRSQNAPESSRLVHWNSFPEQDNYFGGDLRGIIEKFDYLKELGTECIYLTPIFKAEFNHKYATTDYFTVDPAFGTLTDLQDLVKLAHSNGIKIILDGVFNHVGRSFPQFSDLLDRGKNSSYKEWFYPSDFPLTSNPLNYECVGDYPYMPKLRTAHPDVRNFILSVMIYWIEQTGIDGWRLDVADEMEMSTLQTNRMVLKEKYPDILLLGETWGDAFRLVGNGDQMDSAMNYLFRNAVLDWIAKGKIRATNFDRRINQLLSKYNDLTNSVMYNLIGSHDTARFLSEAGENKNKLKLAAAFQMTFCGSPAVYYGDEIGMSGENDPGCRAGMIWDQESQDRDLFQWYRCFIELRKAHPALRKGTFRSNFCDDEKNIYGFIRQTSDEALFVLMNNSENCSEIILPVPDRDAEYRELFSSMIRRPEPLQDGITFYNQEITEYQGQLSIPIDAYSVQIYKKEK